MNTKLMLAGIMLLSSSSAAMAEDGDWWLNLHIGSSHSGPGYYDATYDWKAKGEMDNLKSYSDYNESNLGIGFEYEAAGALGFKAGFYDNSVYETSIYAGLVFHTDYSKLISASFSLGGITGYEKLYGSPIMLLATPAIQINPTENLRAEITYIPSMAGTDSVIGLSLGIKF